MRDVDPRLVFIQKMVAIASAADADDAITGVGPITVILQSMLFLLPSLISLQGAI